MEQILQAIKAKIEECKRTGNSFSMPNLDREDVVVERRRLDSTGSILFHEEYDIRFPTIYGSAGRPDMAYFGFTS